MINPLDVSGRCFLVTGASSGLGREIAILLSQLGARVILVGRNKKELLKTVKMMEGENHVIKPFDLRDVDKIPRWLKDSGKETGPLDGLVHSAGVAITLPLRALNRNRIEETMDINFYAALILTKAFRQKGVCSNGGSVVYISSVAGLIGVPGLSAYSSSKGALNAMCKSLAMELAKEKIRINCVAPGHVMTEIYKKTKTILPPENFEALEAAHPLGLGQPRDVANAVVFLLGDAGRWITGTTMVVDGGCSAH
jgi:NAD(P)-dependent dehydrogenase (short-subunit alcohol dehydrogenase family)